MPIENNLPLLQPEYAPDVPTIFSDGASNFNHSPEIAKFYLGRLDPPISGAGLNKFVAVAQIAMSMSSFVQTTAFFVAAIQDLSKKNPNLATQWESALRAQTESFKFNE